MKKELIEKIINGNLYFNLEYRNNVYENLKVKKEFLGVIIFENNEKGFSFNKKRFIKLLETNSLVNKKINEKNFFLAINKKGFYVSNDLLLFCKNNNYTTLLLDKINNKILPLKRRNEFGISVIDTKNKYNNYISLKNISVKIFFKYLMKFLNQNKFLTLNYNVNENSFYF